MKLACLLPSQVEAIFKTLNYTPSEKQGQIIADDHQSLLVAGGFRGGKSDVARRKAVLLTLRFLAEYGPKAGGHVAWLVGADYEKCRAEFNGIEEDLKVLLGAVKVTKRVDPGQIEVAVAGSTKPFIIKTKSATDPGSLGMEGPVWVVACEAALLDLDVYYRLNSRVSEARSRFPGYGMLMLEGTFESRGRQGGIMSWYASYWEQWRNPDIQRKQDAASFSLPSESNTFLYPLGANDPEILRLKETTPQDLFMERHMGVPVPPSNRVFPMFDTAVHIRECPYDPEEELFITIDPGYSGKSSTYTVLFVQKHEIGEVKQTQWRVIDEIAINKTLPTWSKFTASDICSLAKNRPYWKNPHKSAVIDIAGAAHAGAQESNEETWMKETGLILMHQKVNILPGIDRMKHMLKVSSFTNEPGVIIDPKCRLLGSEYGAWANPFDGLPHVYRYPEDAQGQVLAAKPRDEYCDGIKALTYLFVNQLGYADARAERQHIRVKRWGRAA